MIGGNSAAAFFTESIIAAKNQYESMQTSEDVRRSIYRKAKQGGTYGWTRLGYRNTVDRLADGRKVAIAEPDPERAPFLTLAFQLYASGEYSIPQLEAELYRLGLRSRPRKLLCTHQRHPLRHARQHPPGADRAGHCPPLPRAARQAHAPRDC